MALQLKLGLLLEEGVNVLALNVQNIGDVASSDQSRQSVKKGKKQVCVEVAKAFE
jgi:hypothetical protein